MKKLIVVSAFVLVSLLAVNVQAASVIVDWTFESTFASYTGVTATTIGPILAETGTGSAFGSHVGAPIWSAPAGNGSAHSLSSNNWSVGDYYLFQTSTIGFASISATWDQTSSTTGPRDFLFQYSLNGTSFTTFGSQYTVGSVAFNGGTQNQALTYTRTGISTALANQANVYFRLIDNSTFGNNVLTPTPPGGTQRLDNFKILGVAPLANPSYWDINGNTAGLGGTGTWDTTTTNFNSSATGTGGTVSAWDASKSAVFGGTAGTVTVAGPGGVTTNGGIQFDVDGYTITGTTITLGTTSTIQVSNPATTGTVNARLAGTNGLTISGNGTTKLGGTNTFQGQVTVSGATLSIDHDSRLGDVNNGFTLDTGTLMVTDNVAMPNTRLVDGTGSIDVASGKTLTVAGATTAGNLAFTNTGTTVLTSGTKNVGALSFNAGGTLRFDAGGTGTALVSGNIQDNATTGTATINGAIDFGSTAASISASNAASTIVITGGLTDTARVNVAGAGTVDLQGDNAGLTNANPMQVGNQGLAGPKLIIHNANSLGNTGQIFFNSGTIFNGTGSPLTIGAGLTQSLGSASSAANQFTNAYGGADIKFLGAVSLFENSTLDNRITVNNTTTFAGGWAASSITTASPSVVINGSPSGKLVIAGTIDLEKPMAIQTVTVDLNGVMTNPAASVLVSAGGTVENGIDNAVNASSGVTVGSTINGSGTWNLNGHNQTLSNTTLVDGSITGSANTITATTNNFNVQNGSISAKLAGSVGLVKNSNALTDGTVTLSGNNSYTGDTTVNAGTLIVAHTNGLGGTGGLTINNAAVTQIQAGVSGPVQLASLTLAGGATPTSTLDITDNNLIVHNGNAADVTAQIANAFLTGGGGLWTGTGITSSLAEPDSPLHAVGYMANNDTNLGGGGDPIYGSWPSGADSGTAVSVVASDVLVKYTYFGDADLDGQVDNGSDYLLWSIGNANNLIGWDVGDFDYSGSVDNSTDYLLWSIGFGSQGAPTGSVTAVPEPSTFVLAGLGLAGIAAFARRRRKSA